jgi:hypothetical protein
MTKIIEIDCTTGESVERDMTQSELDAHAEITAAAEADRLLKDAEANAKAAAKASAEAKLSALGLTADEIAALSN